jgi:hypothetical protein
MRRTLDFHSRTYNRLAASAAVYVAGLVLHTADHIRRGTHVLTGEVLGLGFASTIVGLVIVGLILVRHPRAPALAAVFGPVTAVGVAAVHIPPRWGVFSDAFIGSTSTGVTAFSWAVVLLEIVGALALGISGFAALRAVPE